MVTYAQATKDPDAMREYNRLAKARQRKKEKEEQQLQREIEAKAKVHILRDVQRELSPQRIEQGLEWMSKLVVPDGPRFGQPFDLEDWQKEWVRRAMAKDIQVAGLSIARKNAKTMVNVLMEACFLAGPWNSYGWIGIACADVGDHAALMRNYLEMIADMNGLSILFNKTPRPGRAFGKQRSELHFLAADKHRTGHASNADIVWIDEAGALEENQRGLWNALYSAIGSKDGKLLALGNQRQGPMFLELEARAEIDDTVFWRRYSAPQGCDPLEESVWSHGNPGLGSIKSLNYMRGKAKDALISPGNMNYFMSFDLNMNVDPDKEAIVFPRQWNECIFPDARLERESVVLGIDMGGSVSMSAAFAIGLDSGTCRTWTAFSSEPDILSRGRDDGVDTTYVQMRERGELRLYPGRLVSSKHFISDVLLDLAERECRVLVIGADRFRRAEFEQALKESGARCEVAWRGQGRGATADGSNDVRAFQRLVFNQRLKCPESLGMVNAILNSHIEYDNALNPRLEKNKSRGRIDLLTAAVIAAGLFEIVKKPKLNFSALAPLETDNSRGSNDANLRALLYVPTAKGFV